MNTLTRTHTHLSNKEEAATHRLFALYKGARLGAERTQTHDLRTRVFATHKAHNPLRFQRLCAPNGDYHSLLYTIIKGSNPSLSANQTAEISGFSFSLRGNVGATFSFSASAMPLDDAVAPPKT